MAPGGRGAPWASGEIQCVQGTAGTRRGAWGSALTHAPAWACGQGMALGPSVPSGARDAQVRLFLKRQDSANA